MCALSQAHKERMWPRDGSLSGKDGSSNFRYLQLCFIEQLMTSARLYYAIDTKLLHTSNRVSRAVADSVSVEEPGGGSVSLRPWARGLVAGGGALQRGPQAGPHPPHPAGCGAPLPELPELGFCSKGHAHVSAAHMHKLRPDGQ